MPLLGDLALLLDFALLRLGLGHATRHRCGHHSLQLAHLSPQHALLAVLGQVDNLGLQLLGLGAQLGQRPQAAGIVQLDHVARAQRAALLLLALAPDGRHSRPFVGGGFPLYALVGQAAHVDPGVYPGPRQRLVRLRLDHPPDPQHLLGAGLQVVQLARLRAQLAAGVHRPGGAEDVRVVVALIALMVGRMHGHLGGDLIALNQPLRDLLGHLTMLNKEFTSYQLKQIGSLSSFYAIRLYELMSQFHKLGQRECTLDQLRQMFDLGEKYQDVKNMRVRVLDPALKELNAGTDLSVTAEPRRRGRKIIGFVFTIAKNEQMALELTQS